MAEAIHRDDGKGKREKKERGGGSGVGDDDDVPRWMPFAEIGEID